MARFKIDRRALDLQVKSRDCGVLVGPFPPCTPNAVAATGIFEGCVGNRTRGFWVTEVVLVLFSPMSCSCPHFCVIDDDCF
jgi:hypothetical protein